MHRNQTTTTLILIMAAINHPLVRKNQKLFAEFAFKLQTLPDGHITFTAGFCGNILSLSKCSIGPSITSFTLSPRPCRNGYYQLKSKLCR